MLKIEWNPNISYEQLIKEYSFKMFKYNNHLCVIIRQTNGHYCGYVGVYKKSKLFELNYTDIYNHEISVHGGLTYTGFLSTIFDGIFDDKVNFFGFDTGHYMDEPLYKPGIPGWSNTFEGVYRNFEYVKNQVESLSDQLKRIEENPFIDLNNNK